MNWDDPSERAALIDRIGPKAYNEQHAAHRAASVLEAVGGHEIRPVYTRFGKLFSVGNTGMAYQTIEAAREYAKAQAIPIASGVPFDGRKS